MRIVIQRVSKARITIDKKEQKAIGEGLVILLGITPSDGIEDVNWLVNKVVNLRIFNDEYGVMNRSSGGFNTSEFQPGISEARSSTGMGRAGRSSLNKDSNRHPTLLEERESMAIGTGSSNPMRVFDQKRRTSGEPFGIVGSASKGV